MWFEQHPARTYRVRPALTGELPCMPPPSAGWSWIVVKQIQPGVRVRASFTTDAIVLDSEQRARALFHCVVGRRS